MEMKYVDYSEYFDGFGLGNFLSEKECQKFIQMSEDIGYEEAEINSESGSKISKDIRNNDRVIINDKVFAEAIFEISKKYLPDVGLWKPFAISDHIRFYRYVPGQYFKNHVDGTIKGENINEKSILTFLVYLNDDFEGGGTSFSNKIIKANQGSALIFFHGQWHSAEPLISGTKYALRLDVMYRKK